MHYPSVTSVITTQLSPIYTSIQRHPILQLSYVSRGISMIVFYLYHLLLTGLTSELNISL